MCIRDSCEGVCFLLCLGPLRLRLSERWLLGHTVIHEYALDERRYAMDFRMIHPWFGQVFRYAGIFATDANAAILQSKDLMEAMSSSMAKKVPSFKD